MRPTVVLLATVWAVASAHSDPHDIHARLPKLVGGAEFMANLKARNVFSNILPRVVQGRGLAESESNLKARVTETCGPNVGSCDPGYCCSPSGFCGVGVDYCTAPDCQFLYGPACDANTVPAGPSTNTIPRPKIGNVVYGGLNTGGVQDCFQQGVIAFSFDDGPYVYTKDLLDLLDSYGAKATFFITGNNLGKGEIDDCATGYPQLIKRMYNSGHQIASHTWSHQDLSKVDTTHFQQQIYYNEMALRNILGVIPTYMRPPYSSCSQTCSDQLSNMGYHVTYFDLDTEGYLHDSPEQIQVSKDIFTNTIQGKIPSQTDYLLIEHDIHYQTVYNLTRFILDSMKAAGYGAPVTVGDCLADPKANWYRSAGQAIATCAAGTFTGVAHTSVRSTSGTSSKAGSSIAPTTTSTGPKTISTDASCWGQITCQGSTFGNCCSQYGWCGNTTDYCSTGCQPSYGSCGASTSTFKTSSSSSSYLPSSRTSTTSNPSSKSTVLKTLSSSSSASTSSSSSSTSTRKSTTSSSTSSRKSSSLPASTTSSTAALPVSTDARCGDVPSTGKVTCEGSEFGDCCSQYGWCGSTTDYCGDTCQESFGSCW